MKAYDIVLAIFVGILLVAIFGIGLVYAQNVPQYTASPSATPTSATPTAMSDPVDANVACTTLTVEGSGRFVPSTTTLVAEVTGTNPRLRWDFGDGVVVDTETTTVRHTYRQPGTYTIRLSVGSDGTAYRQTDCTAEVSVDATPLVSRNTTCWGIQVDYEPESSAGDLEAEGREVRLVVVGEDNKEAIPSYRMDFGDGAQEEQESNVFTHTYAETGTYQIQAGVRPTGSDEWVEGSSCRRDLIVERATPVATPTRTTTPVATTSAMTKQPETGAPTWLLIGSLGMLSFGVGLYIVGKQRSRVHG